MSAAVPVSVPAGSPFARSSGFGVGVFLISASVIGVAAAAGEGAGAGVCAYATPAPRDSAAMKASITFLMASSLSASTPRVADRRD